MGSLITSDKVDEAAEETIGYRCLLDLLNILTADMEYDSRDACGGNENACLQDDKIRLDRGG